MLKLGFLLFLTIGISLIPISFSEEIPNWVKNNASWWSDRLISQSEFTTGIEFLINEGIIYIPQTEVGSSGPDKIIPDWVRNTAGWWSDNRIPDSEFINAMKYLIEIGLIEVDASSPEVIEEENIEINLGEMPQGDETPIVTGQPLLMLLEGYNHVHTDGKFVLDILIFDADEYPIRSPDFSRGEEYKIDGVTIDIELHNEEELIHTFSGITKDGFLRYEILARETNQAGTLWMINNLYTVNIRASLDGQTVNKNYEFLGQASAYAYNAGSAIRASDNLTATGGDDLVKLSWTAPSGVKGISDYTIQYSTDGSIWTTFTEASVSDIRAADAESDGSNSFTELAGASGVDTFTIDGTLYAIVTGNSDDGVQIIDISDPTNIVAKDAETDESNSFTELEGVREVKTFKVPGDTNTYAIAVSPTDDGVQILNITDPAAITATDAETDGSNSFTELKGAIAVDVYSISGKTYAIVAAQSDDGVQIIDISDPTDIVAKDAQDDGDAGGFDRLDGPRDVKVFTVSGDSNTYAIVTSFAEHAVQILNITDPAAITATDSEVDGSNSFTELEDAFGVDTFAIDSSTYAIVTGFEDDGVQIIDISDPTDIVAKDAQDDGDAGGFDELNGAQGVDVFIIGSNTYAAVASKVDKGIQILDITDPTAITATDAQDDGDSGGFDELNGAREVKTFEINSQVYAIITADTDSGIQVISLDGVGSATSVVVDGLDNETLYYFRIAAENYSGLGKYSSIVSATTT